VKHFNLIPEISLKTPQYRRFGLMIYPILAENPHLINEIDVFPQKQKLPLVHNYTPSTIRIQCPKCPKPRKSFHFPPPKENMHQDF
jgi:hypothetical protein